MLSVDLMAVKLERDVDASSGPKIATEIATG
jgi:hypothetical protein